MPRKIMVKFKIHPKLKEGIDRVVFSTHKKSQDIAAGLPIGKEGHWPIIKASGMDRTLQSKLEKRSIRDRQKDYHLAMDTIENLVGEATSQEIRKLREQYDKETSHTVTLLTIHHCLKELKINTNIHTPIMGAFLHNDSRRIIGLLDRPTARKLGSAILKHLKMALSYSKRASADARKALRKEAKKN